MTRPAKYCTCEVRVDVDSHGQCRPCRKKYKREYDRTRWLDPYYKMRKQSYSRKLRTGCTSCEYQRLLVEQGGCCALCPATSESNEAASLCADHDHVTGRVRGLLCNACNVALGYLGDTAEAVAKTAFGSPRVLAYLLGVKLVEVVPSYGVSR